MTITWEIKAAIAAAILAVLALVGWFGVHEYHTVLSDQTKIGGQTQVIKDQANTIQQAASTAAVTDTVVASAVQADQAATVGANNIQSWVATQSAQIEAQYASGAQFTVPPATSASVPAVTTGGKTYPTLVVPSAVAPTKPAPVAVTTITSDQAGDVVPTGKDAALDTVQLTGSWMTYCAAVGTGDPKCASVPKP